MVSVPACARDAGNQANVRQANEPVLVFAASDLRDALVDLVQRYRADGGDSLVLVFGSTGDLATQIGNGAPADLLFAANAKAIDDLAARGRVIDSTRAVYAIGRLALVASCPKAVRDSLPSSCPALSLADLASAKVKKVAIADPSHAPYGLAARQTLERANLWARVQPKIVMGANISQAEQFVSTGNADAGLIALSLVRRTPERVYTLVDSALHDPLRQTVAVIAGSPRASAAMQFLQFMRTEAGTQIMQRYGFTIPAAHAGSTASAVRAAGLDVFPLWLSFAVASVATCVAILVGVPLAWILARREFRGRSVLEVAVLLPMVLPPTVIGYYLLLTVGREGPVGRAIEAVTGAPLVFTPAAAVLATLVAAAPFLVRAAQGGFEQVDTTYEDAARTLGRSEPAIFFTITVPLAWRGILAGTTLCFARAMGEFGATLMLAGNIPGRTQTASLAVYDAVQAGDFHRALVLSLLLSIVTGGALWLLTSVGRVRGSTASNHRR